MFLPLLLLIRFVLCTIARLISFYHRYRDDKQLFEGKLKKFKTKVTSTCLWHSVQNPPRDISITARPFANEDSEILFMKIILVITSFEPTFIEKPRQNEAPFDKTRRARALWCGTRADLISHLWRIIRVLPFSDGLRSISERRHPGKCDDDEVSGISLIGVSNFSTKNEKKTAPCQIHLHNFFLFLLFISSKQLSSRVSFSFRFSPPRLPYIEYTLNIYNSYLFFKFLSI